MQELQQVILDTNVLLDGINLAQFKTIFLPITIVEELDKIKHKSDGELNYKVRRAIKQIKEATNIEYKLDYSYSLPIWLDSGSPDNKILGFSKEIALENPGAVLVSRDYNMLIKGRALGLKCESLENFNNKQIETYNGIRELSLTEQEYVHLLENPNLNINNFYPNEYVIINNKTSNDQYLLMWNGKYFEEVKIRSISNKYVNKINPLDIYQKAFIHMLQNDNVKIKITDSDYGTGKSYLMIHWALQMLDREKFNKLYFVKSDNPPKNRKEYPAIPGNISEKSEPLMGVLCDVTSEDSLIDILLRNNKLEILPIQFAKGRSLKKTILYINECQDFTPSEMERLLSRIDEDTVVLLDGSTKQIDNKYCFIRNGLTVTSMNFRDKRIAAQVNMVENYRSELSKMVSEMDWRDYQNKKYLSLTNRHFT
jgi:PhoH-like ATPase